MHPSLERLRPLVPHLICPACGNGVTECEDEFSCSNCSARYPIVNGCPVLMTPESEDGFVRDWNSEAGRQMLAEYAARAETVEPGTLSKMVSWLRPPEVMYRYNPDLRGPPTDVIFARESSQLMLNVGGGPHRESDFEFTLNLRPFHNVDIAANAERIPLADNSFDVVYSLAVLEHVSNPETVVAEMFRVLKPGGRLYAEIPFIFFFHGYPADYTRYTLQGMEKLFAEFEEKQFGMSYGPVSATLQCGNMLIPLLVPERYRILRKLASGLYRWLLFPLKYLDKRLRHHPDAHTVAGGFYVMAQKPDVS